MANKSKISNELINIIKNQPLVKKESEQEYDNVNSMTLASKGKYALEAAINLPIFANTIKLQGDIILDQKLENDQLKGELELSVEDEKKLEKSRIALLNTLSREEKDLNILNILKSKVNDYSKKNGIYCKAVILKSDKPFKN